MSVYEELKKKGIVVLSLSVDKNEKQWLYAQKVDSICWVSLRDKSDTIKTNYKVSGFPTTFLINKEGEIVFQDPSVKEVLSY